MKIFLALSTGYSKKCDCPEDGSSKLLTYNDLHGVMPEDWNVVN